MTEEKLKNYRILRMERDQLSRLIRLIQEELSSPPVQKSLVFPRSARSRHGGFSKLVAQRLMLSQQWEAKQHELTQELKEIEDAVQALPPLERTLLRLHYLEGKTWDEVADALHYSLRHIHRLRAASLKKLHENEN